MFVCLDMGMLDIGEWGSEATYQPTSFVRDKEGKSSEGISGWPCCQSIKTPSRLLAGQLDQYLSMRGILIVVTRSVTRLELVH